MKNKQSFLFYLFFFILLLSRIIQIVNTPWIIHGAEKEILFISSSMADGNLFSRLFFQENNPHCGGGRFIYSSIAVPFIWVFGKSAFSVRLASIIFLILIYSLTYKFCYKYFGLKAAIFSSLLFIVAPEFTTTNSIIAEGRYFHLNLFFVLSLYFFSKIKETKKTLDYLLFGLACGLGIYFYPAFLVTFFVFGLFLLLDIDLNEPSFIYKYFMVIICIIIAGSFLTFNYPWYDNFYRIITIAPKNIHPSGSILLILPRFVINFFWHMPNILLLSSSSGVINSFSKLSRLFFSNLTNLSSGYLEAIRFIFITSFVSLVWLSRKYLKRNHNIPTGNYIIIIFLLTHVFVYILLFSFNESGSSNRDYYLPLLLNIIFIMAIFLDKLWQRNKYLSLSLLFFILLPGANYQFHNFKIVSPKEFYKRYNRHYMYFYYEEVLISELIIHKPIPVEKLMCDKLGINVCRTIATKNSYIKDFNLMQSDFKYLSNGNIDKSRYLYQSYLKEYFLKTNADTKEAILVIEWIDKEYRNFCYIGLGEGLFTFANSDGNFDLKRYGKIVEETSLLIKEDYKEYFFQGLGEGLARRFAAPSSYSPYIAEGRLYDDKILDSYVNLIYNKEYRQAFLAGFFNKEIWANF
ncbi:MAG: glycosyltransferase family 39 protein [Candidatus Omnitrophica bacterium]|nr:glycosyltransferase family 39 protein [Candidatus Omnitrophota bacterium]